MIRKISGAILCVALSAGAASAQTLINAGGATFPEPIYSKWFHEYQQKFQVAINYQAQGSGFGISAGDIGHHRFRRQRSPHDRR